MTQPSRILRHVSVNEQPHVMMTQFRAFETSRAEGGMDFCRRPENPFRDRVVQHEKEGLRVLLSSVVESCVTQSRLQTPVLAR